MGPRAKARTQPAIVEQATGVGGLRLIRGQNVTFAHRRAIVHADYALKLTMAGCGAPYRYRGVDNEPCREGGVSLFEPFEPVVAAKSAFTTSFVTLLVDPCLIQQAYESGGGTGKPTLDLAALAYPSLVQELRAFQRDAAAGLPSTDLEERLISVLDMLVAPAAPPTGRHTALPPAVVRSRELILDRLAENFGIEELEEAAGYSRFHLIRLFRRYYGLSLHEFRLRARVAMAMRLLARGRAQADVAGDVGFFDQSHFHRHFRRIVGVAPGQFVRPQRKGS